LIVVAVLDELWSAATAASASFYRVTVDLPSGIRPRRPECARNVEAEDCSAVIASLAVQFDFRSQKITLNKHFFVLPFQHCGVPHKLREAPGRSFSDVFGLKL